MPGSCGSASRDQRGTTVRLQHGETLDAHGNFTIAHLQFAWESTRQEVRYTLKGDAEKVYTTHFTFHSFRFVKVEEFPGKPRSEQFTGLALYSDLPETGTFECSDPPINRLQQNILWSQKSNFLEIPTDCPTRERAGWTGDIQIFAHTGSFLMQTTGFLSKWLKDLAMEQAADGQVVNIVPARPGKAARGIMGSMEGSAGYGDAAVHLLEW